MATRIYLPSTGSIPSGLSNPTTGTWTETTGFVRRGAVQTRTSSAFTSKTQSRTANAANNTWLDTQYAIGPLAAQTFGVSTVKGTIRALESAINDNVDAMRLLVRVVAPDGTTFRGTIYGPTNGTVAEFNTTLRAKRLATGGATTSVAITEGDYLVIEIGATATTGGTSISTDINYGDNSATDLGDNETDTAANNPFIEFAANMIFLRQSYGQTQAKIKAFDIKGFGQSQADIKAIGRGFGQAQSLIYRKEAYGQAQALIPYRSITDTFTRSVVDGLGTADIGGDYVLERGTASQWDVNGSKLIFTASTTTATAQQLPSTFAPLIYEISAVISEISAGNNTGTTSISILGSSGVRFATLTGYGAVVTITESTGAMLVGSGNESGSGTVNANQNIVIGDSYNLKAHVKLTGAANYDIKVKIWKVGSTEPGWRTEVNQVGDPTYYTVIKPAILITAGNSTVQYSIDDFNLFAIGWTEHGQAQALISRTQGSGQTQAVIFGKAVLGQTQASIKRVTVNGLQGRGSGLAQAVIGMLRRTGQAQARIYSFDNTGRSKGQAQAFLIGTSGTITQTIISGQAGAIVKSSYIFTYENFHTITTGGLGQSYNGDTWGILSGTGAAFRTDGKAIISTTNSSSVQVLSKSILPSYVSTGTFDITIRFSLDQSENLSDNNGLPDFSETVATTYIALGLARGSSILILGEIFTLSDQIYVTNIAGSSNLSIKTAFIANQIYNAKVRFKTHPTSPTTYSVSGKIWRSELPEPGEEATGNAVNIGSTVTSIVDILKYASIEISNLGANNVGIVSIYSILIEPAFPTGLAQAHIGPVNYTTTQVSAQAQAQISPSTLVYAQVQALVAGNFTQISESFNRPIVYPTGWGTSDGGDTWAQVGIGGLELTGNTGWTAFTTVNAYLPTTLLYNNILTYKIKTSGPTTSTIGVALGAGAPTANATINTISGTKFSMNPLADTITGSYTDSSGTLGFFTSQSFTITNDVWYNVKVYQYNTYTSSILKVKIWLDTDTEPVDWTASGEVSHTLQPVPGIPILISAQPLVEWDDIYSTSSYLYANGQAQASIFKPPSGQAQALILSCYEQTVKADSPISYWRLGEASGNPRDSVGTNHVTSIAGTGIGYGVSGALTNDSNTAINMAGSASLVIPNNSSLNVGDTFSVEFWFKRSSSGLGNLDFVYDKGHTGGDGIQIFFGASDYLTLYSDVVGDVAFGPQITDTTSWHHAVVTKSGATRHWYIDGSLHPDDPGTNATFGTSTNNLRIGSKVDETNFFHGSLDEVALYNVALTGTQVAQHYSTGLSGCSTTSATSKCGQAQATIKQIGRGCGQTQADIKNTYFGLGQAQSDVKATSFGLGQAQADIKVTSFGLGQSQSDIKATGRGCGQANADIKTQGYGLGQANADIKNQGFGLGQAQADVKAIGRGLGQVNADIKATSFGLAQAQADIKQTSFGLAQAQADIKNTYFGLGQAQACIRGNAFGQAQADIKQTYFGLAQAQADIKQTYFGLGQSNADIKAVGNGCGQANADIKNQGRGFGQAQADIKQIGYGLGQSQADIKNTYYGLGQSQADIKNTYYGLGQSQADIKNTYFGLGQAQAWIKQTYYGLGQAQACIRGNAFGQAQADIKQTYYGLGQSQADIKNTYYGSGQANCSIVQTGFGSGQCQADIKHTYTQSAQTQADIKNTYVGCGQAAAWIKNTYYGSGQSNADVKQVGYGLGQSQADIKAVGYSLGQVNADIKQTGNGSGQSQGDIKQTYTQSGQSQADIRNTYYGSGQAACWIKQTYSQCAQAQADIKTTYTQSGQSQADVKNTYTQSGQSQADIETTYNVCGQAQGAIKNTYYALGQAQAKLNAYGVNAYGQAQGNIRFNGNAASGQAQAKINAFDYNQWGQSQGNIKNTYYGSGQSQADIKQTYNQFGQAQGTILQTYYQSGQANSDIKAVGYGTGQAQATIRGNAFGQSQADIKNTYYGLAQTQAKINAFGVQGYGQCQGYILSGKTAFGQAQGDIKAVGYGSGQSQSDIKATETSSGQSQADIRNTYFGSGQCQAWIKQTYFGEGQAQGYIRTTDNSSGQAQGDIKQTYTNSGQAQSDIRNTYYGSGQANCLIGTRNYGNGQANADIKATVLQSGQSQSDIKNTYQGYGQAQSDIKVTYSQSGQANAYILLVRLVNAQAQAQIKNTYVQSGQSLALIKNTYNVSGNAQGTIKQTVNNYAQAQAQITSSSYALGQAQATITSGTAGYGQAQAQIQASYSQSGQAEAFISKLAGYGQAQGFIRQDRIIKNLILSDRHSITLSLSDRLQVTTTLADIPEPTVTISDERDINLSLSDSLGIHLVLSDRSY